MSKVYFIGAGPGDPELITIKGKNIIEDADIIIYAGSLVNKAVLAYNKKDAVIYNSAGMNLDEVAEVYKANRESSKVIARVHTGDPTIYGAIREQIDILEHLGLDYEVIPGVSSFTAACAAINKEFTLPGVSQTVICTRIEGRTPVPGDESLDKLASHKASMAIFLSVGMMGKVVAQLNRHYDDTTPVSVVYHASWEDQIVIRGTLADIEEKVKAGDIKKTAMILVGRFQGDDYEKSKLYDKHFSHEYRQAT